MESKYNAAAYLYCLSQPLVSYHIVIISVKRSFYYFNNLMMQLLCEDVVEESCLISTDKMSETHHALYYLSEQKGNYSVDKHKSSLI